MVLAAVAAILAEQEWARGAVEAIDGASEALPQVPPLRGPEAAEREEITGRVVAVADGDSFTLLAQGKRRVRVRLAEIDAPESGQAWGSRAKKALSLLIHSKRVRIVTAGLDGEGWTLARVFVKDLDVNAEMVRRGSAHAYRENLTDVSLLALEDEARVARRGLWSLRSAHVRPWEWRHAGTRSDGNCTLTGERALPRGKCPFLSAPRSGRARPRW